MSGDTTKDIGQKYQTSPTIETVLERLEEFRSDVNTRLSEVNTRLDRIETQLDRVASVAFETRADLRELKGRIKEPA